MRLPWQPVPPTLVPPPRPETAPLPTHPTLPPANNLLQPPTAPTPETEMPSGAIPGTIMVDRFKFVGNTAISSKTLGHLLAPYTKKGSITFAELFQARTAVTQLYYSLGYVTSAAFIPRQTLLGGVVIIHVVEGKLESIKVIGVRRLNRNYVRERLRLAASKPLNRNRLLEALQLLQLNPLSKNISAKNWMAQLLLEKPRKSMGAVLKYLVVKKLGKSLANQDNID